MSFRDLMNNSVIVKKRTRAKDDYGTMTETLSIRYANVPCRLQPMSGREQSVYNSDRLLGTDIMFCEAQWSGIVEDDVVLDGDVTYDVQLVRNIDHMGHHLEIELKRIAPEI